MVQNGGVTNSMSQPLDGSGELHIFDYIAELSKNKFVVAFCLLAATCIAVVTQYTIPKMYVATALVMPPKADGSSSLTARMAALNDIMPGGLPGAKNANEVYLDILRCQRATDAVIDKFSLMKRWGIAVKDEARSRLIESSRFGLTAGQLVSITFVDTDPQTAADMANAYADVLRVVDREINVNKAGCERRFLDERISEVEKDLYVAQKAMLAFQQEHRIISVDEGLRATATVMGELEAERQSKEIRLQVLETVYAQGNPEVEILRAELEGFHTKLEELASSGVKDGAVGKSEWLFPAVEKAPALALEQLELERRLKLQANLYELLTTQRELVRVNEAREMSTMQVISPAIPPDSPINLSFCMRLLLWCAAGAAASVGVVAVGISLRAYRARANGERL